MRQLIVVLVGLGLLACDRSKPELEKTLVQVQQISAEKDSLLKDVMQTSQFIADINSELGRARARNVGKPKQGNSGELESNLSPSQQREAIKLKVKELTDRLNDSEARLSASRNRVAALAAKNGSLGKQLAAYDSSIAAFKTIVENQKSEIATLTTQVNALQTENVALKREKETLSSEKVQLADEKRALTMERNTVFYVIGTRGDLLKRKIIDQSGGWLGLGKTQLPARDVNPADFTAVDKTTTSEIAFPHADKSYRIITRQDVAALEPAPDKKGRLKGGLKIKDAEKFWAASKYLIVLEQ